MELRKAEMEAAKAENMVEHEAEISARHARTSFQTCMSDQSHKLGQCCFSSTLLHQ